MTLIVVGVSHRSAPFELLDLLALNDDGVRALLDAVIVSDHVAEAMVVSTCNRVEIYADVDRFHGAVEDLGAAVAKRAGLPVDALAGHLYVHYDERAVHHVFSVAAGLDSMVVGEQQILGQVRQALRTGQEFGSVGRTLNELGQSALRVGKRVHTDTEIDRHGASVVSVALDRAAGELGGIGGRRAAVIGAGAMASLAVAHLHAAGAGEIAVVNRTAAAAQRLSEEFAIRGANVRAIPVDELDTALAEADLVVACTGATDAVIGPAHIAPRRSPRVLVDLALPHDIDPAVRAVDGVVLIDLAALATDAPRHGESEAQAAAMVEQETRAFIAAQAAASVEPLVVSLRSRADGICEREVSRLRLRLPALDDASAAEVERAMRRAMSTLLHTPTVRMKELAADADGERFAEAVRALFDLDPATVHAITDAPEAWDA